MASVIDGDADEGRAAGERNRPDGGHYVGLVAEAGREEDDRAAVQETKGIGRLE
jgi:hypothetical protein